MPSALRKSPPWIIKSRMTRWKMEPLNPIGVRFTLAMPSAGQRTAEAGVTDAAKPHAPMLSRAQLPEVFGSPEAEKRAEKRAGQRQSRSLLVRSTTHFGTMSLNSSILIRPAG